MSDRNDFNLIFADRNDFNLIFAVMLGALLM